MSVNLPLLCFNDVYRVRQRFVTQPGSPDVPGVQPEGEIGVGQFGQLVNTLRKKWTTEENGTQNGLVLFAGDVFSPSVESSVTRGSHMVRLSFTPSQLEVTLALFYVAPLLLRLSDSPKDM